MVNRLVSVGEDFKLPPAVKAEDANLPTRLGAASLNATYATAAAVTGAVAPKLDKTEAAAKYASRAVDPRFGTPLATPSALPVTVEVQADRNTLSWDGTGGIALELHAQTGATLQSYFAAPVAVNTSWLSTAIVYPDYGTQNSPPWNVLGVTTNSKRLRLTGRFDTGRGLGPWILVDGQPIGTYPNAPALTYTGVLGGMLLTFPDSTYRTIEIVSTWGWRQLITDASSVTSAFKRGGPSVAVLGDSWVEGTTVGGIASFPAWMTAATRWRILSNGQGGTGYVADPDGAGTKTVYGSRVAALVASLPDVLVVFGSINDTGNVQTGAAALFDAVATASPATKIIVIGPQLASAGQASRLAELQAAATGKANVLAVIDPTTWQTTGLVSPTDGSHPSPLGVQWTARKVIESVRSTMFAAGDVRF